MTPHTNGWHEPLCFGDLASDAARRWGERTALVFQGRRTTYAELSAQVDQAAKALMAAGVRRKDHVALWLNNSDRWVVIALAILKTGAVLVPINTRFRTHDLDYVLRQSDSNFLITHDVSGPIDYLAMVREVVKLPDQGSNIQDPSFPELRSVLIVGKPGHAGVLGWEDALAGASTVPQADLDTRAAAVQPQDLALIKYTSGTTGFPKGAMHCHNLIRNVQERGGRMGMRAQDVIIGYLPLFHAFGFSECLLMALVNGAKHVVTETFNPAEALDMIEAEGVTIAHGFDAHIKGLYEEQERRPRNIATLRTGVWGAGPLSTTPVMYKGAAVLAPCRSVSGFGMTEVWIGVTWNSLDDPMEQRLEANGWEGVGYAFRIADPATDAPVADEVEGELQVRGRYLMLGYYKKPDETRASYSADGWFKTGDAAKRRADGTMHFLGRHKDMLKVGGENVDPMEIEGMLRALKGVHEVSVVAAPDPVLNEVAVAYVQRAEGSALTEAEIINSVRGKVASFKIPRYVVFIDEFPMTASGKIRKVELRADAKERFASE